MINCPSAAELEQLLAGQLTDPERVPVENHVEACATCQEALARLTDNDAAAAELPPIGHAALRHDPGAAFLARLKEGLPQPSTWDIAAAPTALHDNPALPNIPGYEVLGELGRGGMGVVYKARQRSLNRLVALKMILAGQHAGTQERARFRTEAEAAASLQHANIVQIHEVGEHDGFLYLAQELAEGPSLAARLDGTPWPGPPSALLIEQLAHAMHYAHERGVVHRDLKPSNILLANRGVARGQGSEAEAKGISPFTTQQAKIIDFGLAKRLDAATPQTHSGALMGTPSYMAPEQAAGKTKDIGPRTDVYALGAVLYELLTGRPPFRAATPLDTLLQVRQEEPRPLRSLNPRVDRGLEAVCLKCLEKDPLRRYESAQALAKDLSDWLAGAPILARPPGWGRRAGRALRRPAVRVMAVGLLIALTVLLVVVLLSPPKDPDSQRQEKRWKAIQRDLAAGKPATLIAETGWPANWRWRSIAASAIPTLAGDGTFSIQHVEFGLLELLAEPPPQGYLFHAEVRHDHGTTAEGQVGIYFAHSEHATEGGLTHFYAAVAWNDLMDNLIPTPHQRPQDWPDNTVALRAHYHPPGFADHRSAVVGGLHQPFASPPPNQKPWRRFTVEFTPERVRVSHGGVCVVDEPRAALAKAWEKMMLGAGARVPAGVAPAPGNGLGLFVRQGAASFRSVVIEPLTDKK